MGCAALTAEQLVKLTDESVAEELVPTDSPPPALPYDSQVVGRLNEAGGHGPQPHAWCVVGVGCGFGCEVLGVCVGCGVGSWVGCVVLSMAGVLCGGWGMVCGAVWCAVCGGCYVG